MEVDSEDSDAPCTQACPGIRLERAPRLRAFLAEHSEAPTIVRQYGRVLDSGLGPSAVAAHACMQEFCARTSQHGCCAACDQAWYGAAGGRTEGASRGPFAVAVDAARRAARGGHMLRSEYLAQSRAQRKATNQHASRRKKQLDTLQHLKDVLTVKQLERLGDDSKAFLQLVVRITGGQHVPGVVLERWSNEVSNGWRQGRDVHGRRYPKDDARISAALDMQLRGQNSLCQMLTQNHLATLPDKKTVKRRTASGLVKSFGVQPAANLHAQFYGAAPGPDNRAAATARGVAAVRPRALLTAPTAGSPGAEPPGAPMRLHCAFDEVAVNGKVQHIPHPDGHEIAGLANRIARQRSPQQTTYVLTAPSNGQEGKLLEEQLDVSTGSVVVTEHPITKLDIILTSVQRARYVCLWLLRQPTRGTPVTVAATMPTLGDMTTVDDITMFHSICEQAVAAHMPPVCYIGGDFAHAPFFKGIVRAMTLGEEATLRSSIGNELLEAALECTARASNSQLPAPRPAQAAAGPAEVLASCSSEVCTETPGCPGRVPSSGTAALGDGARGYSSQDCQAPAADELRGNYITPAQLLPLVPLYRRPIGVLQTAIQLLCQLADGPDSDAVLAGNPDFEWRMPYAGLPFAAALCAVSKRHLGISFEWRHALRLPVCDQPT